MTNVINSKTPRAEQAAAAQAFMAATKTAQSQSSQSQSSVPLSVYKELNAELQSTRAMVDTLNTQNHQLTQENQSLRQEMHRFVQSAVNMGVGDLAARASLPNPSVPVSRGLVPQAPSPAKGLIPRVVEKLKPPTAEDSADAVAIASRLRGGDPNLLQYRPEYHTEIGQMPNFDDEDGKPKEFNPLWVALTVMLVILTAFGAGFLIVRPLLPNR
jgi:hypothetical protein